MLNNLYFKKGIYLLSFCNTVDEALDNKIYIGKTDVCFLRRYLDSKYQLESGTYHNKLFQEEFNKNKKFYMYVIENTGSYIESSIKEKAWIEFFNNSNFKLYNKRKINLGYGKKRKEKFYNFQKIEIYEIKNKINGKRFLTIYPNYMTFQGVCIDALETNNHKNIELQSDWNKFGHDNFTFTKVYCGLNNDFKYNYYNILSNYSQFDYIKPKIFEIYSFDTKLLDKYYIGMKPKEKKKQKRYLYKTNP